MPVVACSVTRGCAACISYEEWFFRRLLQVSRPRDFTEQEGQLEQTQVQLGHAAQTIVASMSGSTPNAAQSAHQSGAASRSSNPEAVAGVGTSCPLPITPQLTLEEANQYAKLVRLTSVLFLSHGKSCLHMNMLSDCVAQGHRNCHLSVERK